MGHTERIIAELATLDEAQQASLLAFVEQLKRMPARVFLDSDVLIYSVGDDEARRRLADELIAARPVVSAQVLAETAAVLRRKFKLAPAAVLQILAL